ncbi:MAG: hypothetical protein JWQ09_455 [Segetibacter sp.]|nr:hypothetical protein [Segetibacter sp.]
MKSVIDLFHKDKGSTVIKAVAYLLVTATPEITKVPFQGLFIKSGLSGKFKLVCPNFF